MLANVGLLCFALLLRVTASLNFYLFEFTYIIGWIKVLNQDLMMSQMLVLHELVNQTVYIILTHVKFESIFI